MGLNVSFRAGAVMGLAFADVIRTVSLDAV